MRIPVTSFMKHLRSQRALGTVGETGHSPERQPSPTIELTRHPETPLWGQASRGKAGGVPGRGDSEQMILSSPSSNILLIE